MKITLLSLPAVLAVTAFVIYGLTLRPLSADEMRRCTVLVERVSYYEIDSGGRPQAWFRAFGDSLLPSGVSLVADSTVTDSRLTAGVWVNRYCFFPSCRGRVLIPEGDSTAAGNVAAANRDIDSVLRRAAADAERRIAQLDGKASRLRYYLGTHNVSDDGYNTMAAYSAAADTLRSREEKLLSVLRSLTGRDGVSIRRITKYTLLYCNREGRTERIKCNDITVKSGRPFRIIQTADRRKPGGQRALYFHRWPAPALTPGDNITTAAFFGSGEHGFCQERLRAGLFPGVVTACGGHDVPPLLAPDGSPVFTSGNRFAGITVGGGIVKAGSFAFGFNDMIE